MVLIAALCIGSMITAKTEAQVQVSLNVNIESQPVWGPVGYDYAQYYYMPEIDMYYYVPSHQYVYLDRGRWIFSTALPTRYRNYDFYSGYKVVINEPKAYLHHNVHVVNYAKYKTYRSKQVIIRDSRETKYVVVNNNNKTVVNNNNKVVVNNNNKKVVVQKNKDNNKSKDKKDNDKKDKDKKDNDHH